MVDRHRSYRHRYRFRWARGEQLLLGRDPSFALDRSAMLAFEIDEGRDRRTGKAPYQHATRQHARNADKPAFASRQAVPPIYELVGHGTARIGILALC